MPSSQRISNRSACMDSAIMECETSNHRGRNNQAGRCAVMLPTALAGGPAGGLPWRTVQGWQTMGEREGGRQAATAAKCLLLHKTLPPAGLAPVTEKTGQTEQQTEEKSADEQDLNSRPLEKNPIATVGDGQRPPEGHLDPISTNNRKGQIGDEQGACWLKLSAE